MFIEIKDEDVSKAIVALQKIYDDTSLVSKFVVEYTNAPITDERGILMEIIEKLALPTRTKENKESNAESN